MTIHHRIPRRYPDLGKEELAGAGIIIDKVTVRICEACHRFIEGMQVWACPQAKYKLYIMFREEILKIDVYVKEVLIDGPKN